MKLSYDIISQFAKVINEDKGQKQGVETTVYGVVVSDGNGNKYVKLDGSDQLTPLSDDERPSADSTTANANVGDRVAVSIKNHTATVTGNTTSPSVRSDDFNDLSDGVEEIKQFDIVLAKRVQVNDGYIKKLQTDKAEVGDLSAATAKIAELEAKKAKVEDLTAAKAEIDDLKVKKLDAEVANIKYATVENLKATNVKVGDISGQQAKFEETTTNKLTAIDGNIKKLDTDKLSANDAAIKYAQIDFANIGKAAIEHFYATSGIIKDLVIGDTSITGKLVGVTIVGDLIEGGTVKADKLVIQGTDGLYYKLNTDGMKTTAEQTEYNSLNGSILMAKSVTAEKVNVHDLVAFDATIGGFNITDSAIYSGVKNNVNAGVRGTYIDKEGQIAFGDSNSYLKYYKDADGNWKLEVSASSVKFTTANKTLEDKLNDIDNEMKSAVVSVVEEYAVSDSTSDSPQTGWAAETPKWEDSKFIWRRQLTTYGDGHTEYSAPALMTGNSGAAGKGVKVTEIAYQASTSGTTIPTGTWASSIPAVSAGSFLWTRTIITYTDNSKSTSYSIGKMGNTGATGAAGKGVKSTAIMYQASSSGTSAPTGTWSSTIPATSASKPFLWTKTVITYTDNDTSTIYSVGSTPDGIQIGGRNLVLNSSDLSKWTFEPGISISKEDEWVKVLDSSHSSARWGIYTDIAVEPNTTYTLSVHCKNGNKVPYVGGGPMSKSSMGFGQNWEVSNAENGIRFIITITTGSSDNVWRFYLCVNPNATGQYVYFKLPKLEKGNKATDWTLAPEDIDNRFDTAETRITQAETSIETTNNQVALKASTETVTEIGNRTNQIDKTLSDALTTIQHNSDAIASLTARDFKVEFTTITKQLESLNGDLSSYKEKIGNWMRFDADGNLVLGATRVQGQDAYELKLTKNRISFMLNDDEVAYISNNELYITNSTVVQNLKIGKFVWEIRGNGNLGLVWR